jgi:hypothetical protein
MYSKIYPNLEIWSEKKPSGNPGCEDGALYHLRYLFLRFNQNLRSLHPPLDSNPRTAGRANHCMPWRRGAVDMTSASGSERPGSNPAGA